MEFGKSPLNRRWGTYTWKNMVPLFSKWYFFSPSSTPNHSPSPCSVSPAYPSTPRPVYFVSDWWPTTVWKVSGFPCVDYCFFKTGIRGCDRLSGGKKVLTKSGDEDGIWGVQAADWVHTYRHSQSGLRC